LVLPSTHLAVVILLVACAVCWALWIYVSKLTISGWRYELYYVDVCAGLLLASVFIVATLGTLGPEMTFGDRLLVAGTRAKAWVALGGVALTLGNFLFLAGLSLESKVSPIFGVLTALALNFSWIYRTRQGTILVPVLVLALLFAAVVYFMLAAASARSKAAKNSAKGRAFSVAGGIFIGGFYPLLRSGLYTDIGVGPYGALIILAIALTVSTLVFGIYFLNLPVNGPPVGWIAYRGSGLKRHATGLVAGALYAGALVMLFLGLDVAF
jgi:glucose uptake protein